MEDRAGAVTTDVIHKCSDISDIRPFYPHRNLFLKPVACLYISVQIPSLKISGQSISTKVLTEKIKSWIAPDSFCSLRLVKSTVEFMRFEGEIENKSKLQGVINRLDGKIVSLPNFMEQLKVRASIMKPSFPLRHDWDSFFRDAKTMNEMKPGERPDTLYISNLPSQWFCSKSKPTVPSESVLVRVFEHFGSIRAVDIPSIDPYREQMNAKTSGLTTFSFDKDVVFDAYVQFKEYIAFVKAMDTLRGMKLLKMDGEKAYVTHIKVDFDKTKHLSEYSIRKRRIEREKLIAKEAEKEEKKQRQVEEEKILKQRESEQKVADENAKEKRRKEREERRKAKVLRKLQTQETNIVNKKIAAEERLLLIAQRKLESIRLLSELLERVKGDREKNFEIKSANLVEKQNTEQVNELDKGEKKSLKKCKEPRKKNIKSKTETKSKSCSKTKPEGKGDYSRGQWGLRTGRPGSRWSSKRNSNYPKRRSSWYDSQYLKEYSFNDTLYNETQKMYYKYFQSICKLTKSSSKNTENGSDESKNKSRDEGSKSHSRKKSGLESSTKRSRNRKRRRNHSRSKSKERDQKKEKMRKTRWGTPIKLADMVNEINDARVLDRGMSDCHTWSRSPSKDRALSWEDDIEDLKEIPAVSDNIQVLKYEKKGHSKATK